MLGMHRLKVEIALMQGVKLPYCTSLSLSSLIISSASLSESSANNSDQEIFDLDYHADR